MRYIGDIHGKLEEYRNVISGCEQSVQVGDFGMGFGDINQFTNISGKYGDKLICDKDHNFIRGNHDDPQICEGHPNWISDGTFEYGVLYIGGAWSIDHGYRTPGFDWWPDEELSEKWWTEFLNSDIPWDEVETMVTHDFPHFLPDIGYLPLMFPDQPVFKTRTSFYLEWLRNNAIKPKLWIGGHWHTSLDKVIDGTRYICLNELEYIDI